MTFRPRFRWIPGWVAWLAWCAAVAVAVVATWAWLRPGFVPAVGCASGVALAALMLEGLVVLPAVALGFAAGALALGAPLPVVLTGSVVGTLQALGAWAVLRLAFASRGNLDNLREVSLFFVTVLMASLLGGTLAAASLLRYGAHADAPALQTWLHVWTSQLLGMLLFTPAIVRALREQDGVAWNRETAESLVAAALALAIGGLLFLRPGVSLNEGRFLPLAALPLIAWTSLRGPRVFALVLPVPFVLMAVAGAARHVGVFNTIDPPAALVTLQGMGCAIAVSTLAITSTEVGRRRALTEARQREAQLRRVLEGTQDGFWDWDARSGQLHVSDRLPDLFGVEPGSLTTYPGSFLERTHPDDLGSVRAIVEENLRAGSAHYRAEYRVRRGDGHWAWLLERARVAERDAHGAPLRVSGTISDITTQKQAERELRAARELFESFMHHSPALATVRDASGRVLFMNDALVRATWGPNPPEWRGRHVSELFPPHLAEILLANDRRVLERNEPVVEERQLTVTVEPMHAITMKFPLHGPEGERLVGGVAVDVTAQRTAESNQRVLEAHATEAQRLESLGRLAGGVAHDFNNILTGIVGFADLAREQLPPGDPARGFLASILQGAQRAGALTHQMLACAGRGPAELAPVLLGELVSQMTPLLEVSIPRRVRLVNEHFGPPTPIHGDEAQMRQVVANLVLNAAEAIGETSGTVTVRTQVRECTGESLASRWSAEPPPPGRYVVLEVSDDGCGMSAETLAHVFDPFFSTKFAGRGLGLAAVLGIVRAHRGVVQVESAPASGSTFRVLLPATARAVAARDDADGPWRASGVALVVDDEPGVRELAATMLRRIGFDEVLTASGGRDGLATFREHAGRIRVVLLDFHMPDLSGETVLRQIRRERPDTCVLVSSGYLEPGWSDPSAPPELVAFVPKPYRLTELARAVRGALEAAPA